jgi:hypothetical protein
MPAARDAHGAALVRSASRYSSNKCVTGSKNAEPAITGCRDAADVDGVDACARRTGSAPRDHSVDRRRRALEFGLYRAVAAIAYPSTDALRSRPFATRVPEPHALDPPADLHVHAYRSFGTAGARQT